MESSGAQLLFFNHIKGLMPPHISFVDEIAETLEISNDSAYRRIRGEKPISLEEVKKLCIKYKVSLDQLLHLNSDSVVFSGKLAHSQNFNFELYLQDFLRQHEVINSFEKKEVLILSKDVPLHHYYNFPELAAFKYFFWMKTILHYPDYNKAVFNPSTMTENLMKTGEKILATYNQIPSTEIWNIENVNTTLRQIEYYIETNVFASKEDVLKIYDCLERSIDHVELQAEAGYKINQAGKGPRQGASLNLYINEFSVGDNTYLAMLNGKKTVFLVHTFLNYMNTSDAAFAEYTYSYFQNILHKSTLISVVGEKDRRIFFNKIRSNINERKNAGLSYYF
ncbi:MAG: helix-turn-helix domain-containing protein [Ginsengibacter sp.]